MRIQLSSLIFFVLPIFVLTFREKSRLNHIILSFRYILLVLSLAFIFSLLTKCTLDSLFGNVSENIGVAFSKITVLDDKSYNLSLINLGNSLKIVVEWLEFLLMYRRWLLSLLLLMVIVVHKCYYVNQILNPQSFITFKTFFFTLPVSGPDKSFNTAWPWSLYNPGEWCSKSLLNDFNITSN